MTLIQGAFAAVLAAGGVTWAVPAAADPDLFGTYSFAAEDGENATWTLTPCADNPPGCVRVSETGNSKRAPWSGDAHWSVGSLILVVQQPDAILCQDGPPAPGMNTYSWDGTSMSGSASILTNGACGTKSASLSIPFKLNRIGAAEAQVPPPSQMPPASPAPVQGPPAAPAGVVPAAPVPAQEMAPTPAAPLAAESTAGPAATPPEPTPVPAPPG